MSNTFTLLKQKGRARAGILHTPHGDVHTPAFMNIATAAAIKGGVSTLDLESVGCQIMLCNAYHLHVRPGDDTVRRLGGLHTMTHWSRPILTDSGGFQVFSLAKLNKITEEGVSFASHVDGRRIFIGPEQSIAIQQSLGSDIAMAFDECIPNPSPYAYVDASVKRTARWLERCKTAMERGRANAVNPGQLLFGINQGGTYDDLRVAHMQSIAAMDCDGYAIGGLAVGETAEEMYHIIDVVEPHMPTHKPRYLMGVGTPENIREAVLRGVDMFDCVIPSRNARHGTLYTRHGKLHLHNKQYEHDTRPIEEGCTCEACTRYSRAYLRHLFKAGEMLAMRLCVMHNLTFYNDMMARIRAEILE